MTKPLSDGLRRDIHIHTTLPCPIDFADIRVGDEVKATVGGEHGAVLVERTFVVGWLDDNRALIDYGKPGALNSETDSWTLLARPEPEPLVPDEPTLGVLELHDGRIIRGVFSGTWTPDLPQWPHSVVFMVADRPGEQGSALVREFGHDEVKSFTPITVQPEGTTAVPTDYLQHVITAAEDARGDFTVSLNNAAIALVRAVKGLDGGERR